MATILGVCDMSIKSDNDTLKRAMRILEGRMSYKVTPTGFTSPDLVKNYLKMQLAEKEREVFACLFLDNRHRLIEYKELFYGTLDGASVHPREVVKAALKCNAAALILSHNHPSGVPEPSKADEAITARLKQALDLIDIRILDHIIIGGLESVSFAERGLI